MTAPGPIAPEPVARFARDLARCPALRPSPACAGARIEERGPLALAVSGGPDSLALLLLAHAALPGGTIAATVDHGLRPAAAAEARAVARLCARIGVPHATLPVRLAEGRLGIQAAARAVRYAALTGWAAGAGATTLATAHHRDDQAETVLMRLARGAGLDGLAGVRPARPLGAGLTLVRPLLGWSRAELAAIVDAAGIAPADDTSNRDPRFDRTRARAFLAHGWPRADRLAAAAAHLAQAHDALAWAAARLADERIVPEGTALAVAGSDLPRELRRRLLLAALARLAPNARPRGDAVARLLDRLEAGQVSTLAGVRIDPGPPWRLALAPPHRSF